MLDPIFVNIKLLIMILTRTA